MKKELMLIKCKKYPKEDTLYDVETEDHDKTCYHKTTTLRFPHASNWSEDIKGNKAYSITNSGNGYVLKEYDARSKKGKVKKSIKIDYLMAEALRALLDVQDKEGHYYYLAPMKKSKSLRKKKK